MHHTPGSHEMEMKSSEILGAGHEVREVWGPGGWPAVRCPLGCSIRDLCPVTVPTDVSPCLAQMVPARCPGTQPGRGLGRGVPGGPG